MNAMAFCYQCGEEIEFINNGFGAIPIHPSGSCSGRGGGRGYGSASIRISNDGDYFEFPFVNYPSYINPNARCPVCGASVYFYQSPYGGRVFFDELGPPWPKHPCTDTPVVRNHFSTAEGRKGLLFPTFSACDKSNSETEQNQDAKPIETTTNVSSPSRFIPWRSAGWMPFVVTKIINRRLGIEAEGKLFSSDVSNFIPLRIIQASIDARYYQTQRQLRIGSDLIQNSSQILSVLNECPILLKKDPDLEHLILSSFILDRNGGVEEITLTVTGIMVI